MEITGTFKKVNKNTRNIVLQGGNRPNNPAFDAGVDGHGTIISGYLHEWAAQYPEVAAKLAEFGITGVIRQEAQADGYTDGTKAFEHMRQHESSTGTSMVRDLRDNVLIPLGLMESPSGEGSTPDDGTTINDYPGAPPLSGPGSVYERLALYGLITAATPYDGPMPSQKRLAELYYKNKLVPGVNEEQWMRDERGLRPLPERWAAPDNGVYLFRDLERRVGEWGLAVAEGRTEEYESRHSAVRAAYETFKSAWIPKEFAGAPPAFGDREYNPRSLFYAADRIENAIAQNNPTAAAVSGPRTAFALGQPQVFSLYEGEGFRMTAAPMQINEWRMYLGLPRDESQAGPGSNVGTPRG